MSVRIIEKRVIYGSHNDESFQTDDPQEAEAFDFLWPLRDALRARLNESGRFTTASRLDGRVEQDFKLLLWFETNRRKATPLDHFGMGQDD